MNSKDIQEEALQNVQRLGQEIEQEPVVGTKTWVEDGKVITQNLYASDIYKDQPQRQPLTFDEVEACFPDGVGTNEHGEVVVSAQWLHDFAVAVQRAAHGIKGEA